MGMKQKNTVKKMRICQRFLDIKDGTKFWWLPWFPAKNHLPQTFQVPVYKYWHDYILTVTACLAPDFLCGDGVCLDSSKICDGLMDCSDGTDESNDQCNGKKHLCNQATVWIEQ